MLVQDLISVNEHTPQNFSVSLVLQSKSLVLAANNNCFEKKSSILEVSIRNQAFMQL